MRHVLWRSARAFRRGREGESRSGCIIEREGRRRKRHSWRRRDQRSLGGGCGGGLGGLLGVADAGCEPVVGLGDGRADVAGLLLEVSEALVGRDLDDDVAERVGLAEGLGFGGGGVALFLAELGRDGVGVDAHRESFQEGLADAVRRVDRRHEELVGVRGVRGRQEVRDLLGEPVGGGLVAGGEAQGRGGGANERPGEEVEAQRHFRHVVGRVQQRLVGFLFEAQHGVLRNDLEALVRGRGVARVVDEDGVAQKGRAEGVGQAAHEHLFELEAAAQQQSDVRREREVRREPLQPALVLLDEITSREVRHEAERERPAEVGKRVRHHLPDAGHEAGGRLLVGRF
mmetsp:Transcript_11761/g.35271  ORF Transcript_11761/g.35271 Transcript_11761/m.35271 type:complete len:343 (-) Transcript_11761:1459-2487(-)